MILILKKGVTPEDKESLKQALRIDNCLIKEIEGVEETIWEVFGKTKQDIRYVETLLGVAKVIPISNSNKLYSRELQPNPTR
ncbi:MAG: phospho-2-dehydro-3-deoxyheptonate aldolase, partial [Deltaproteobacteria bacterium]|nr:phospho-2-dehydro-3-deoxyheptonate aldolase [Deltaproteobacteria bacterium]